MAAAVAHRRSEEQAERNPGHLIAVRLVAGSTDSMLSNSDNHRKRHKDLGRHNTERS